MIKAEWTNADALDLQPTCNQLATDCISRQEALNIRFSDAINEDGVLYVPLRDFTDGLKALPSAQPERPSGKWLSHYDYCKRHGHIPSGMMAFWWCDQCEQGVDHTTKFCPHCGAKMLREDNK